LRTAVASDASAIAACVNAAYAQWIPVIGRKPWPMLQDYAMVIETEQVVVAESNGAIAGVLVLSTTADGFLIENVAVLPELRSRGIGRALLIRAEQEARTRGHGSLYLTPTRRWWRTSPCTSGTATSSTRARKPGLSPGVSAQAARKALTAASVRAQLDILLPGLASRRQR
jgi:N-acetylglutamate synthase-like GNAT family acetyltransferase